MVTALYRRYRPETFAEMIGQSQVTEPLMTALRSGRIGHAYLFSGPRGCGKTTSARVLARCLNCAQGPTDTPCGTCDSCIELSREGGGSLDVIEIDAASHGGVDDARDLRERAIFAPARDRYKVFIIDEAHMVTKEGFNALLKIVEEPPEHVKFVFATTEPEKVIGTIRSRTHHYPFRLIPPAPLLAYIGDMCESENIEVDDGVFPLVIRAGGGSARDTLSILDQLIAGSEGNRIDYERAVGLLGYTHDDLLDDAVAAFASGDTAAGISAVDRVVQTGQDPRRFAEDLLERLRDLIIVKATDVSGAAAVLRGVPEDQLRRMFEQAGNFHPRSLSRIADIVSDALDGMTGATAPRLHLELMIARAFVSLADEAAAAHSQPQSRPAPADPVAAPASTPPRTAPPADTSPSPVASPAATVTPPAPNASPVTPPVGRPTASTVPAPASGGSSMNAAQAAMKAREFLARDTAGSEPKPVTRSDASNSAVHTSSAPVAPEKVRPSSSPATQGTLTLEGLQIAWPDLINRMKSVHAQAASVVAKLSPVSVEGTNLRLEFPSQEILEAFKRAGANELRELIQEQYNVRVGYLTKFSREAVTPPAQTPESVAPPQAVWAPNPPDESDLGPEAVPKHDPAPEHESVPEHEPAPEAAHESAPEPAQESAPEPAQESVAESEPAFTRYGEAIVREVLGAKFIEERPLSPGEKN